MEHTLENIEKFVLGQMTVEEANAFQIEIDHDKVLERKVEKMRLISDAMELNIENDLRLHLDELHNKPNYNKSYKLKSRLRWPVAAAILLLLSLLVWVFNRSQVSPPQFVENHYVSYHTLDLRSDNETEQLFKGLTLLRQGLETEAIQWFKEYTTSHPEDHESRFILADLMQKAGQHLAARDEFRQISNSNSILWKEKATWNDILLSVQFDWDKVAKERLEGLVNNESHSFHNLAIKLAKSIDQR